MSDNSQIFFNKKILIYGLGKSGLSSFNFLRNKNDVYLFDDNPSLKINKSIKKKTLNFKELLKTKFDLIILSPGIDIKKCKLKNLLKKKHKNIYTDLDVFCSFYKNVSLTITGTNGKSTTCKLLYDILKDQKKDVRLAGNIGTPILSINKISKKTIFVIEASSYQLEYSKIFSSKFAAILNIAPDHLERHGNLKNYIEAKFKIFNNLKRGAIGFVNKNDHLIQKRIKRIKPKLKLINVDTKLNNLILKKIINKYFLSKSNQANLSFVLEMIKKFKVKPNKLLESVNKFKGLNYRQKIIYNKNKLIVINDSKSTSYSSSKELLEMYKNIHWLIGGIPKKDDKLLLSKKYFKNIKIYIFGKNFKKFSKDLYKKTELKRFKNLNLAVSAIFKNIHKNKHSNNTILFSPASASFDSFKNFEERGSYFNNLIKRYINERKII
ncbi:UDP-N-acetylmuramoyl-L-alanine--D-glutamate ligase [Candidatus Pelagibacter sp.]|uniref:UDP-N-acetylmuramoyl-L-alanine--D-glutamate ligase n=1 Tax=Candidatus Pelagibacter sp. TaxID=2024849 RepID=UPI003F86E495